MFCTCSTHHLQHIRDGHVHVSLLLAVVELRALDHHQVGGEVHAPGNGSSGDQHLEESVQIMQG